LATRQDFPKQMRVIHDSPLIDVLVSRVLPMSDVQRAVEFCTARQTVRVILTLWE